MPLCGATAPDAARRAGRRPAMVRKAAHLVDFIRRIRDTGVTIVLIEHHMDVVMPTCDRITVLNYGKLLTKGTPAEIRADSAVIGAYLGKAR